MLLQNIRARIGARLSGDSEAGFTLIELLVVMLILGILAAIAIPAFFNQKEKAKDSQAKETAHSAQVAVETYATENNGSYAGVTIGDLHRIEPTISGTAGAKAGGTTAAVEGVIVAGTATGYTIQSISTNGNDFEIVNTAGEMTFPCTKAGTGGCPEPATGTGEVGNWAE
jgi:type IV pilus assembly protein PilA